MISEDISLSIYPPTSLSSYCYWNKGRIVGLSKAMTRKERNKPSVTRLERSVAVSRPIVQVRPSSFSFFFLPLLLLLLLLLHRHVLVLAIRLTLSL